MSNARLELTWIGKENRPRLEPRILLEDSERSYHAAHRVKVGPVARQAGASACAGTDAMESGDGGVA